MSLRPAQISRLLQLNARGGTQSLLCQPGGMALSRGCRFLAVRSSECIDAIHLGNMLRAHARNIEAEAAFTSATRTDPTFAEAWYNLGDLLDDQGRIDAAIEFSRAAGPHHQPGAHLPAGASTDKSRRPIRPIASPAIRRPRLHGAKGVPTQNQPAPSASRRARQLHRPWVRALSFSRAIP
jgi:tetratricopeptide (TPR) repeat protein